jgi:hypothetical protein
MSDTPKRPIDLQRESAFSITLEAPDDKSATIAAFELESQLCTVTSHGVYGIRLADQTDPGRTNPAIRNSNQRLLKIGAESPIVSGILLTAERLFNPTYLGTKFGRPHAMNLALQLTREVAAAAALSEKLQHDQDKTIGEYDRRLITPQQITLPTMEDAKDRFDAFAQKLGHALRSLEQMVQLFFPEITSKWIDRLAALTLARFGSDAPFTGYMNAVRPTLLFMLDLRNLIEHPKPGKSATVFDFRQTTGAQFLVPSVEFEGTPYGTLPNALHTIMPMLIEGLTSMSEELIGYLCGATLKPFGGFGVRVMKLPPELRGASNVCLTYAMRHGDQWVRCH